MKRHYGSCCYAVGHPRIEVPPMTQQDELLTVDQVATRLKVHPETVRRWLRSGQLRGVRFGGKRTGWRIRASEVELVLSGAKQLELPDEDARTKKLAAWSSHAASKSRANLRRGARQEGSYDNERQAIGARRPRE